MNKNKIPILSIVYITAIGMITPANAVTNTVISDQPLWGVGGSVTPLVALALSVEYPTAGPAYQFSGNALEFWGVSSQMKTYYRGYFDNQKCYTYDHSGGFFKPVGYAQTDANGVVGICNQRGQAGSGETFSGNFMNALSMSAVDIFRSAMTGGNRAYGTGNVNSNYQAGDTATETYLRRTRVMQGTQNGNDFNNGRLLRIWHTAGSQYHFANTSTEYLLARFLPWSFVQYIKNVMFPEYAGKTTGAGFSTSQPTGVPYNNNFQYYPEGGRVYWNYSFSTHDAYLYNRGYTFRFVRKLSNGGYAVPGGSNQWNKDLNIVVKSCVNGLLEDNCVLQPSGNYKPEGLIQTYTRQGARFASLGYLNDNSSSTVSAAVLRSRMKQLNKSEIVDGITYGQEWNPNNGIFSLNPDTTDANSSGVSNSGTINYLNKFGDYNGYKTWDPAAELYYAALSYLRGNDRKGFGNPSDTPYYRSGLSLDLKDNFPAIYNWDDPFTRGKPETAWQCHSSHIIFIGDTNTHQDNTIPEFESVFTKDTVKPRTYLGYLLRNENYPFNVTTNVGAGNSPAGIAGLAYWARVNDIRPSIAGNQFGNNFMIDVVEGGNYKAGTNSYYLAAKYGGFTRSNPNNVYEIPTSRSQWTDDPVGQSRITAFTNGVPRNYAAANDPDNMVKALESALEKTAGVQDAVQTQVGSDSNGSTLNFKDGNTVMLVQSTYNVDQLSGDIIASRSTFDASNAQLNSTPVWRAATKLNQAYHSATKYTNRKVFTRNGNTTVAFNAQNAASIFSGVNLGSGINAADMVNYMLGDSTKEVSNEWRSRNSILGTIVNSAVQSVRDSAGNLYYVAAANDGMLHVFDADGNEKMAYMVSTAISKLPSYVLASANHQFLNDGTPVIGQSGDMPVVIGTAGRGGASVYALNANGFANPNTGSVLWEFSSADDADLGLTVSEPVITQTADGTPVALVSSGYNNSQDRGSLFVLKINKNANEAWTQGVNYWKISLGTAGVGAPFAYDEDKDGKADKIFVGDASGKLWQLDSSGNSWAVAYSGKPLFTPAAGQNPPITGAPYAAVVNGSLYVVVGSGRYFSTGDLSSSQQNYAYGFVVNGNTTYTSSDLVEQNLTSATALTSSYTAYQISSNQSNKKGWRLKLQPGQLITASANIRKKTVAEFVAVQIGASSTNSCTNVGSTAFISVDVTSGGLYQRPIFNLSAYGVTTQLFGMLLFEGVVNPNAVVRDMKVDGAKNASMFLLSQDGGNLIDLKLQELGKRGIHRLNWREIFYSKRM